ncbi:MAG: hypothetical protein HY929_08565 [Euryarchaeota archaeon]|nr:hypothetical protein [Euryarchaeota archaeon]
MIGPISFTDADIDKSVKDKDIGAYILSKGNNVANYVGRSDSSLKQRLKQHLQNGIYTQFWFETVTSALDAYYLECQWYHKYSPKDNENHPAIPPGSAWKCPVAGCPYST